MNKTKILKEICPKPIWESPALTLTLLTGNLFLWLHIVAKL